MPQAVEREGGREAKAVLTALGDRGSAGCSPACHGRDGGQQEQVAGGTGWYLLSLVPGEGHVELGEDSLLLEAGQLLPVQVVLALMAAAIVQHRLTHLFTCRVTQPPSAWPCQPPALSPLHFSLSCHPQQPPALCSPLPWAHRAAQRLLVIRGSLGLIPRSGHGL